MTDEEANVGMPLATPRTKRRYTLAEDRIVERWYETRHVPWMLRHHERYDRAVVKAGRVLHRLQPNREVDQVARCELEDLLDTKGEERRRIEEVLPRRSTQPSWLADLERLAALGGETGGATLETIGRLKGWRPDQMDASTATRAILHRRLYEELEPLLRQEMRDERAARTPPPPRRRRRPAPSAQAD